MAYLNETGLSHLMDKLKPNLIHYGTCATAAATAAKVASDVEGVDKLFTGLTIAVKFTNSNTKANPTLNVNSLGAKPIMRYGTTVPSTSAASSWNAGSVVTLTYDGTNWQIHDWNNTTYSSMTVAEYEAGTGTTARTITPARLKGAILEWAPEPTEVSVTRKTTSGINIADITIDGTTTEIYAPTSGGATYTGQFPIGVNGTNIGLYMYVAGTGCRVTNMVYTQVIGGAGQPSITGVALNYDDGTTDGGSVFLPDGISMANVRTEILSQIPDDASDIGAAPTSHASTATTYGVGNASNYGHVKLSDTLDSTKTAASGVAATPKALFDLEAAMSNLFNSMFDQLYPIGCIYTSTDSTDPGDLFGGEWEPITETFLYAGGSYHLPGDTGGSETVTLDATQIPAHTHGSETLTGSFKARHYGTSGTGSQIVYTPSGIVSIATDSTDVGKINQSGVSGGRSETVTITATHEHNSVGGGQAHDNMPPYLAVYMWERVA